MGVSRTASSSKHLQALVLNAGSSSLKYGLYNLTPHGKLAPLASGQVESIGQGVAGAATITVYNEGRRVKSEKASGDYKDHAASLSAVVDLLKSAASLNISCVGHRVVHGGPDLTGPVIVDSEVEAIIDKASELAPLHNPHCLSGIRVAKELFDAPQVAVFDTAFHMTLQPSAYTYAIPRATAEKYGVRRYGFHGINYTHVCQSTAEYLGRPLEELNIIACHLGAGSSMACIERGRCIDTTMGLTPLEGLPMAIRSGDIDPGAIFHVARASNMSMDDVSNLLNKESGLKGMCGMADMRSIIDAVESGDIHAKLAREVYIHRIRRYLGAFHLQLKGSVDAIVFTGGIGENDADLRDQVCNGLSGIGIDLDSEKNAGTLVTVVKDIQSAFSRARVLVVKADEEGEIARQAVQKSGVLIVPSENAVVVDQPLKGSGVSDNHRRVGEIYLVPMNHTSTLGTAAFGILGSLLAKGYIHPESSLPFLPVSKGGAENPMISKLIDFLHLKGVTPDMLYGVSKTEAEKFQDEGRDAELTDAIVAKFQALRSKGADFLLVVGTSSIPSLQAKGHMDLAEALGIETIGVHSLEDVDPKDVTHNVSSTLSGMDHPPPTIILNQIPEGTDMAGLAEALNKRKTTPLAMLPRSKVMSQMTASEVVDILGGKLRFGHGTQERVPIQKLLVGTLDVPGILERIQKYGPGVLLVTHAGRSDLLLGILGAIKSRHMPAIAGVVLTEGTLHPTVEAVLSSLEAQRAIPVPIISAPGDTLESIKDIVTTRGRINFGGWSRVEAAQSMFEKYLNTQVLEHLLVPEGNRPELPMTPQLFQWQIMASARKNPQKIILPEGDDVRVLTAADELLRRGLCKVTILGDPEKITDLAAGLQLDLSAANIINPSTHPELPAMAMELHELRKHKGLTQEAALQLLKENPNTFGVMMMHRKEANGMVSGAIHTTADTMRPALQIIKTSPTAKMVSSAFFMLLDDGAKVFADCAIIESPTAEQLAEIGAASALTAQRFGLKPRVAMLSYATGNSNSGPMIEKVREATELLKRHPALEGKDFAVEGPIQFDAAVDPAVAAVKYKGNPGAVAGRANVCVFPDLNAGNNAYKAVQQATHCLAVGPVMQGLRMPVNDLSRGCTSDDIVNTVVMTCVQAIASN